jgi:NAD-dependent SIR2 family protein deacetylase
VEIDQGLLDALQNAKHVLVFTGAGVSADKLVLLLF